MVQTGQVLNPTSEELKAYQAHQFMEMKKYLMASQLAEAKNHPKTSMNQIQNMIYFQKNMIHSMESTLQDFKKDPEKLKKIWVPTPANLAKKTRKELLENLHHLTGLTSHMILPKKQQNQVLWATHTTSLHLVHFQNPFSWHEFNGISVEKPQQGFTLDETLTDSENMYMAGGMYYGGGGYVGGVGAGLTSGSGGR